MNKHAFFAKIKLHTVSLNSFNFKNGFEAPTTPVVYQSVQENGNSVFICDLRPNSHLIISSTICPEDDPKEGDQETHHGSNLVDFNDYVLASPFAFTTNPVLNLAVVVAVAILRNTFVDFGQRRSDRRMLSLPTSSENADSIEKFKEAQDTLRHVFAGLRVNLESDRNQYPWINEAGVHVQTSPFKSRPVNQNILNRIQPQHLIYEHTEEEVYLTIARTLEHLFYELSTNFNVGGAFGEVWGSSAIYEFMGNAENQQLLDYLRHCNEASRGEFSRLVGELLEPRGDLNLTSGFDALYILNDRALTVRTADQPTDSNTPLLRELSNATNGQIHNLDSLVQFNFEEWSRQQNDRFLTQLGARIRDIHQNEMPQSTGVSIADLFAPKQGASANFNKYVMQPSRPLGTWRKKLTTVEWNAAWIQFLGLSAIGLWLSPNIFTGLSLRFFPNPKGTPTAGRPQTPQAPLGWEWVHRRTQSVLRPLQTRQEEIEQFIRPFLENLWDRTEQFRFNVLVATCFGLAVINPAVWPWVADLILKILGSNGRDRSILFLKNLLKWLQGPKGPKGPPSLR